MKTIKDREVRYLIKKIRDICGAGIVISFRTTSKGSKLHSIEYDDDFDNDFGYDEIKREYPKLKTREKINYFG